MMALFLLSILIPGLLILPVSSSPRFCPLLPGLQPILTNPRADLTIGLITSVHTGTGVQPTNRGEYVCNLDEETGYGTENMITATTATLNWPDSIKLPGLSVGVEIYDTCDSFDLNQFSATRYSNKRYDDVYADAVNETSKPHCINNTLRLGVIGFGRSSYTQRLIKLLEPFDIPAIDFTSTATFLSNKEEYPNFFRTVPPDNAAVKALVAILEHYGWTHSGVIYRDKDAYSLSGYQSLKEAVGELRGFCLSEPVLIPQKTSDSTYDDIVNKLIQRNLKVVTLWIFTSDIARIFAAVERIKGAAYDIQWLGGEGSVYYEYVADPAAFAKTARGILLASPYISTNAAFKTWLAQWHPGRVFEAADLGLLIDAVHAYMHAFSLAHQDKCGDQPGMCDQLASIKGSEFIEYVRRVNFTNIAGNEVAFDANGNPVHTFYEVLQFKNDGQPDSYSPQKVGEWSVDNGLSLMADQVEFYDNNGSVVNSTCKEGSCLDLSCQKPKDKFVIEGTFTLHESTCDTLRENELIYVEAALFAVHQINQDPSLLPDVRLSMTVNDICGDDDVARRTALRLVQGWDFEGGFPNQDDESYLMGMLHSGTSGQAIQESKILQIANLALVSNSASSTALSNKDIHGNFLRTVPSDAEQTAVMVDLLSRLDLTYIQTINTRGAYGDGAIEQLVGKAKMKGICIANSFVVDSTTNFAELLNNLIAEPEARTLVLFLRDEHAQALFGEMISRRLDPGIFQILASDTWGTKTDYIPRMESLAVGALTVTWQTSVVPEFEDYFLNLTPESERDPNPFFNEYWEQKFKCNLPGGGRKDQGKNCTGSEMLAVGDVNSLGIEDTVNVIYAYAVALSNLIGDTCPDGDVCDALLDVMSGEWFDYLKEVTFVSPVGSQKMVKFDENGDGPPIYSVHRLIEVQGSYSYEKIASWDNVNGLSDLGTIDLPISSQCTGLCLKCHSTPDSNQTSGDGAYYFRLPGDLDLPVILQLSDPGEGLMCGSPRQKESLVLESLLYALDEVNNNDAILPGVKLGVTVMDSCGTPAIASRKLVGLLGDFVSLESTGPVFAVLGPANAEVAEEIARIVSGPSKLPMVSHSATGPDLDRSSHVLRTSAPYSQQVAAIVDILREYDWQYVGVVYSESPDGTSNYEAFKKASVDACICLGAQSCINETTNFDEIIRDFSRDDALNVVVAFVNEGDARNLLIADEIARGKRFVWVGTDVWDSPELVSTLENAAKGMIVVANKKPDLPEISDYFSDNIRLQDASMRDPYLKRYLEELCSESMPDCQIELQKSLEEVSGEISALVNALYAVAQGANWLHASKCGFNNQDLCEEFLSSLPNEKVDAIQRVTLESAAGGQPFSFDGRSVPASYNIKNYQYDGQNGQFLIVGEWREKEDLSLMMSGIKLYNADAEQPQIKSGCSRGPTPLNGGDYSKQAYLWNWMDQGVWSTVVLAVSGICGVLAILTAVLLLSKRDSYVVQSASFSLSMWLLFGIILMYLLNLAFMFDVNTAICGIRRFGISFVYCVVYAAMLVKSIRANRFARKKPGVDLNFVGSWSQTLLFLIFLLPEVILVGEWLILLPPGVNPSPDGYDACGISESKLECATSHIDLTIFMVYAYFLVLLTFLSSWGTLCAASNSQHEAKPICISSLVSILILIAWACVYNLDVIDPIYNLPAISIGVTADATVILFFMFVGKINSLTNPQKLEGNGPGKKNRKDVEAKDKTEELHAYDNKGAATADAVTNGVEEGDDLTQL